MLAITDDTCLPGAPATKKAEEGSHLLFGRHRTANELSKRRAETQHTHPQAQTHTHTHPAEAAAESARCLRRRRRRRRQRATAAGLIEMQRTA